MSIDTQTYTLPPLNGTHHNSLSQHGHRVLQSLKTPGSVIPRQEINPGLVNRLLAESLVIMLDLPSPYKTRKGLVSHLKISEAGLALLAQHETAKVAPGA